MIGPPVHYRKGQPLFLFICILLGCLATGLPGCSGPAPISIGFAGPLTGSYADLGVQGRNGAQLAIEHVNAAGGVAGRPLELLVADDSGWDGGTVEAAETLIDARVTAVLGHMTSSLTLAALPQYAAAGMTVLSPTTSTPSVTGIQDNLFRVVPDSNQWAEVLARYARSSLNVQRVAVLTEMENKAFSVPFVRAFMGAFRKEGGVVAAEVPFHSSESSSVGNAVRKVLTAEPDAILLAASSKEAAILMRRLRADGSKASFLISPSAYTNELLQYGGEAVEGVITAFAFAYDMDRPRFVEFDRDYRARFGGAPSFAASFSYESVLLLAKALERTKGNAQGLGGALLEVGEVQGVMGSFKLDAYGDVERPYFILTIRNGALTTLALAQETGVHLACR